MIKMMNLFYCFPHLKTFNNGYRSQKKNLKLCILVYFFVGRYVNMVIKKTKLFFWKSLNRIDVKKKSLDLWPIRRLELKASIFSHKDLYLKFRLVPIHLNFD